MRSWSRILWGPSTRLGAGVWAVLAGGALAAGAAGFQAPGNGKVYLDERRFAGIGVNYFDAFLRHLKNPADTTYRRGFRELGEWKVPFARMPIIGYWPADNKLYFQDRDRYFALLDDVVRAAAENRVALIFSFFWEANWLVPDMVGEAGNAWADTGSRTQAFMREFASQVSRRYQSNPWVWAYEFGNEYNLKCNLPNAADHRPPIQTSLGTPPVRTRSDDQTLAILTAALEAFAREIRKTEPGRLILSGNALPRPAAWHNLHANSWEADTRAQFGQMLLAQDPPALNSVTVHVYESNGYFSDRKAHLEDLIHACDSVSRKANRVLFMGEFGVSATLAEAQQKAQFDIYMRAILRDTLPLSAAWAYDFPAQEGEWNFSAANPRRWMLDEIRRVNGLLAERTLLLPPLGLRPLPSAGRFSAREGSPLVDAIGRGLDPVDRFRMPAFHAIRP